MTKKSRNARKLEARKDRRRQELAGLQAEAVRGRVAARAAQRAAALLNAPKPPWPPSLGALFEGVTVTPDVQIAVDAFDRLVASGATPNHKE